MTATERTEIATLLRQRANVLTERPLPDGHESENIAAARELLAMADKIDREDLAEMTTEAVYEYEIAGLRKSLAETEAELARKTIASSENFSSACDLARANLKIQARIEIMLRRMSKGRDSRVIRAAYSLAADAVARGHWKGDRGEPEENER